MSARADRLLDELGCAALLVLAESARDPDVAHLTGPVHVGRCLLVLPRGGPPRLGYFSPMEREEAGATGVELLHPADLEVDTGRREGWAEDRVLATAARRALAACGLAPGRVAVAGRGPMGVLVDTARRLGEDGWTPVAGDELARTLRKTKGERQLAGIRRAAAGACAAFRAVAERLAAAEAGGDGVLRLGGAPLTVGRVRAAVAHVLADAGLEQPAGNIVAPGRDGAIPHSAGDDARELRRGESLVVDLYPCAPPFADCTRTFCVGPPPESLRAAHAAVLQALRLAHRGARPGMRGWELQVAVSDHFRDLGYPTLVHDRAAETGYVHNLGHGVGYELHEFPVFGRHAGAEGVLAEGDVFTLEPGLYDPQAGWGVRLEDLVTLGEGGAVENLTPLPYDLDPGGWF